MSSSGHLQIGNALFGVSGENLAFTVVVHAATVCSTIIVLRREIAALLKGLFRFSWNPETIYIAKIVVSMIPVAIIGFFFKDYVEGIFGSGLLIVGICLLITAALLTFAYYARPRVKQDISFRDYLEEIIAGSSDGTGLTVRSKIDDLELTEEAERFIANTLREGISNGVRHGGSTAFLFELRDMGNYIEFLLSDNGRGIEQKQFKEGFGLSGMRAKAEAWGGMVHYSSEPGEGFEIRLSLPGALKRTEQKDREKQA